MDYMIQSFVKKIYTYINRKELKEVLDFIKEYDKGYSLRNSQKLPDLTKMIFKRVRISPFLSFVDKIFGPEIYVISNRRNRNILENEFVACMLVTKRDRLLIIYLNKRYRNKNMHNWIVEYSKKNYDAKYLMNISKSLSYANIISLYSNDKINKLTTEKLIEYDILKI